jgi:hypothetical protein
VAGIIVADTIQSGGDFIRLNSASQTVATINARGIYANTGNLLIAANGTIGVAAIANTAITGNINQSQIGTDVVGTGPTFQVYGASDVTISNNGVNYLLTFTKPGDQNDLDTHNYYNTSTNRYTPLVAGWYFFSVNAVLNNISSGYVQVNINKNGTAVRSFRNWCSSNEYFGLGGSAMVYCNGTTDYVDTTITSSADGSATVHNGAVRNFCGYLVRKV